MTMMMRKMRRGGGGYRGRGGEKEEKEREMKGWGKWAVEALLSARNEYRMTIFR